MLNIHVFSDHHSLTQPRGIALEQKTLMHFCKCGGLFAWLEIEFFCEP